MIPDRDMTRGKIEEESSKISSLRNVDKQERL